MSGDYKFDTLSLHAGHVPDERHGSRAVPIHQTTSYVFQNTEHAAALYNQEFGGHLYTRISNPTVAVLEQRVAALEGGVAATATASGMAALSTALLVLCSQGDHIVHHRACMVPISIYWKTRLSVSVSPQALLTLLILLASKKPSNPILN